MDPVSMGSQKICGGLSSNPRHVCVAHFEAFEPNALGWSLSNLKGYLKSVLDDQLMSTAFFINGENTIRTYRNIKSWKIHMKNVQ